MPGYWYLATPYALYPNGRQAAYEAALDQTTKLLLADVPVYSPIVHNHPLSLVPGMHSKNGDFDFWVKRVDQPLMDGAGGLLVCCLPTWEISVGIRYEIELFERHSKPIYYYVPSEIPTILPELDPPLETVLAEELIWQDETFPLSTSESRACHLAREARELENNPTDFLEMADVLLLLSHLAKGKNGPNVSLTRAVIEKQEINKKRIWGAPDDKGVVEHLKEKGF